tara:strand:+ start:173 stop:820 length:648 start_codon:yes stop_codon:yes gene_type:complete
MVKNLQKRILTSLFLFLLFFLIFINNFFLIYSLIVLGVFSIIEFSSLMKKINKNILHFTINNFLFISYTFIFCYFFLLISNSLNLKVILYILLLVCIASDLGGFIFGKIFKGPKLTKISPKKTIIGSIGSIILSCLVILILFSYITQVINFKIILLGILTSIGCQFGDLFFSYLKRKAKIKDTGNILPGHGGILDRLDGIFFGLPFGFFMFILLI